MKKICLAALCLMLLNLPAGAHISAYNAEWPTEIVVVPLYAYPGWDDATVSTTEFGFTYFGGGNEEPVGNWIAYLARIGDGPQKSQPSGVWNDLTFTDSNGNTIRFTFNRHLGNGMDALNVEKIKKP
jgi:hypothetical protein